MKQINNFNRVSELIDKYSTSDDYVLNYRAKNSNLTRFADNMLTQNVDTEVDEIFLTTFFDGKKATLQSANLSEEGIKNLIKNAEEMAKRSVRDIEYLPSLTADEQEIDIKFDEQLLELSPHKRAEFAHYTISEAEKNNSVVAGAFESYVEHFAVHTKNGLHKFNIHSLANFSSTFDKNDQKSNCKTSSAFLNKLDFKSAVNEGLKDVEAMQNRRTLPPGKYDILLSASAFSELFLMCRYYGMDRKAYDKGYSAFKGKLNSQIASTDINFYVDPNHPNALSIPFMPDGHPYTKKMIVENGILKNLPTNRFWAEQNGLEAWDTSNFILDGENHSENDLIKKIEKGLYIKNIWYIRLVNPEDLTLTGMTRNALYYIEDGEIKSGATHFRFNDSPMNMLNRITHRGKQVEGHVWGLPFYVPPMVIKDFNLTSGTLF